MERQNQWMSWSQLVQEMVAHYQGQVMKQLYVLVLGLDVIGNPFGLVVGFTKGVEDLFYEPIQVRDLFAYFHALVFCLLNLARNCINIQQSCYT